MKDTSEIDRLIERSSLGEPLVKAVRARTDPKVVEKIVACVNERVIRTRGGHIRIQPTTTRKAPRKKQEHRPLHDDRYRIEKMVGEGYCWPCRPSKGVQASSNKEQSNMADNKKIVGQPDRSRVSSTERYEVNNLAKKHDLPPPLVKKVIQQEGPMRKNVETYLERMKRNGK